MLNRLEIRNFKSIRNAQLDLRALNVVIGPNGAGKSNLIGAFRLLDKILQQRLQEYVSRQSGAARILPMGRQSRQICRCNSNIGRNGCSFTLAPSTSDGLFFLREETHFRGDRTPYGGPVLGIGHKEALLPSEAGKPDQRVPYYVMQGVRDWTVYHFHDTSTPARPNRRRMWTTTGSFGLTP